MRLPDHMIRARWHELSTDPLDPGALQPASLDVCLGRWLTIVGPGRTVDLRRGPFVMTERMLPSDAWGADWLGLRPIASPLPSLLILASTMEVFTVPDDIQMIVDGKSTHGRKGLSVHQTAGFVDPGFRGEITLELSVVGPEEVRLEEGMKIAQVRFEQLAAPVERTYGSAGLGSHYQDQSGPTSAAY